MDENREKNTLRNQLILAGIDELNKYGFQKFSVRRIAAKCGVSCAAPYKHFKDKQSFVAEIVEYINAMWTERQLAVLERCTGPVRRQLLEISLEYIRFLVENPYFRSTLMLKDEDLDRASGNLRSQLSGMSQELIDKYCMETNMPLVVRRMKLYIIRSLIYGAALLFDNGELEYNEENMELVAYAIDREFDLK